jgi:Lon protease-like protein
MLLVLLNLRSGRSYEDDRAYIEMLSLSRRVQVLGHRFTDVPYKAFLYEWPDETPANELNSGRLWGGGFR